MIMRNFAESDLKLIVQQYIDVLNKEHVKHNTDIPFLKLYQTFNGNSKGIARDIKKMNVAFSLSFINRLI